MFPRDAPVPQRFRTPKLPSSIPLKMAIFKRKSKTPTPSCSSDPLVTYHITQSLSGKLAVTPHPPSFHAFSIILSRPKGFKDTIDVAVHRSINTTSSSSPDVVGHCLIEVVRGKFLKCSLGDGTKITLERNGRGVSTAEYKLCAPAHKELTWKHDAEALGGRTSSTRKLKLVGEGSDDVIARFAGAEMGVSEFGVLEVYQDRASHDSDWCGLLVLSAVCVYAREERNREKAKKANNIAGFIGNWGGLLTIGAG
jgi:hypothetical protein